jgi:hypothetical protein
MASLITNLRRATARAQPWPDWLARVGFMAKGLVYLAVGGLAFAAAAGLGGQATDPSGMLADSARTVVGRTIIAVVALGLIAHAVFCAVLALIGEPYGDRAPLQRLGRRLGNTTAALVYFALAATAVALSTGWKSSRHTDDDATAHHWSAHALHAPLGRPLLIAVAGGLTIAAAVQLSRVAWPGDLRRRLRVEDMGGLQHTVVAVVGRLAFLSRAAILGSIAYFVWRAAIFRAPGEARGPGGALHAAWEVPYGNVLLGMMAGGLIAVGAFAFLEARWRRLFTR